MRRIRKRKQQKGREKTTGVTNRRKILPLCFATSKYSGIEEEERGKEEKEEEREREEKEKE